MSASISEITYDHRTRQHFLTLPPVQHMARQYWSSVKPKIDLPKVRWLTSFLVLLTLYIMIIHDMSRSLDSDSSISLETTYKRIKGMFAQQLCSLSEATGCIASKPAHRFICFAVYILTHEDPYAALEEFVISVISVHTTFQCEQVRHSSEVLRLLAKFLQSRPLAPVQLLENTPRTADPPGSFKSQDYLHHHKLLTLSRPNVCHCAMLH